ncbi:MAG: S-layer homology domain-containing protein [Butyricicoccaceae bacterium]
MKKHLSLVLALALCLSLCVNALAAGGMENFKADDTASGFADVAPAAWYYESVQTACACGLVKGTAPDTFSPDGTLTVAEAIVMADRVHMRYHTGADTLANGTPWYQPYVDYALAQGLIAENAYDSYTRPVTRAEMADLFSRALPEEEYAVINFLDDGCPADAVGHRYEAQIRQLYRAGILTGSDVFGTFAPDTNIKRSEAAAILSRLVVPSLRRQVTLLRSWTYDDAVTLAVPYASVPGETGAAEADEALELTDDNSAVCVYKSLGVAADQPGMTVLDIPCEALGAELTESLGADQMTAAVLAFGSLPAYRYDFTAVPDEETGIAMEGSIYVFLREGDLYMVTVLVLLDGTEADTQARSLLKDMVNNVTVDGSSPSVRLAA